MLRLANLATPVEVKPTASTFGSRRPLKTRSRACSRPTARCRDVQLVPDIAPKHATTEPASAATYSPSRCKQPRPSNVAAGSSGSLRRGGAPGKTRGSRAHRCLLLLHPRGRRSGQANVRPIPDADCAGVTSQASHRPHDRQRGGRSHECSPNLLPPTSTARPCRCC